MAMMKVHGVFGLVGVAILAAMAGETHGQTSAKRLYENNFEKAALDSVPEDFLVIDGAFAVKQEDKNRFLELPGAPVDLYGLVFGPTEKEGIAVTARIFATSKGRRFPSFGVGLNGQAGYKVQVSSAKKLIELIKGDAVKKSVPYEWTSAKWTHLRLQLQKQKTGKWKLEGKVWSEGRPEPNEATIAWDEEEEPFSGRASIWGSPFAGTPLRFDDLVVTALPAEP